MAATSPSYKCFAWAWADSSGGGSGARPGLIHDASALDDSFSSAQYHLALLHVPCDGSILNHRDRHTCTVSGRCEHDQHELGPHIVARAERGAGRPAAARVRRRTGHVPAAASSLAVRCPAPSVCDSATTTEKCLVAAAASSSAVTRREYECVNTTPPSSTKAAPS